MKDAKFFLCADRRCVRKFRQEDLKVEFDHCFGAQYPFEYNVLSHCQEVMFSASLHVIYIGFLSEILTVSLATLSKINSLLSTRLIGTSIIFSMFILSSQLAYRWTNFGKAILVRPCNSTLCLCRSTDCHHLQIRTSQLLFWKTFPKQK